MKLSRSPLVFLLPIQFALATLLTAAEPAPDAAGYWEGVVNLPSAELVIKIDLAKEADQSWRGTIDMPQRGLRGFKLDAITVDASGIAFALPGLPGEPRFAGKFADDGKGISGEFKQGQGSMPFKLERKPRPAKVAEDETPAVGVPGKGVAGNWRASLKPIPGVELRLAMELTTAAAGGIEGVLTSLDQGNARIPITAFTEIKGAVHFETASVNGSFDGKLNPDGSEIAGDWSQGGRTTPLVFKRTATLASPR